MGDVIRIDVARLRSRPAPGPGECECGADARGGRLHDKWCPATRTEVDNRFVPWCPWSVCRGPGAHGRDCGPCTGPQWRPDIDKTRG